MTDHPSPAAAAPSSFLERLIARVVHVGPGEIAALVISFAYFFCVLAAYYIIRPVRDEMGVSVGKDGLQHLFTVVFFVMIAAVPIYGWLVSNLPRRQVVPAVYAFFIANLIAFWIAFRIGAHGTAIAATFFVWASVFNLFVVSMFWVLMSEFYRSDQAKRLYGFISAGGTAGALAGPLITKFLVAIVAPTDLLLASAALLGLALVAVFALRRLFHGLAGNVTGDEKPAGAGSVLAGALAVWNSPYLFRIAAYIFIANLVGTYFYLEQSRIVGEAMPDRAARVDFFATRDFVVSVLTILIQVFVAGRVMEKLGVGVALAALPVSATLGLLALSVSPTLAVVAAVMVAERAIAFSLSSPGVKTLYTVVGPEEKYKAQNFIDTVVYRGGDAASGWFFEGIGRSLGLTAGAVAALTLPITILWLGLGRDLGRRREAAAKRDAVENK